MEITSNTTLKEWRSEFFIGEQNTSLIWYRFYTVNMVYMYIWYLYIYILYMI